MKLKFDDHDQLSVVGMRGEMHNEDVDAFSSNVLKRMDRQIRDFVLEMSGLDRIYSKGLEALLWLEEQATD